MTAMEQGTTSIEASEWQWFGHAAHFICSDKCRFHLATQVGKYLVSTVGELWPERAVREIHARSYDPKWFKENHALKGDYFDAAYMKRFGYDEIGYQRKYETMVFKAGPPCNRKDCGCGVPSIDGGEIDLQSYGTAKHARDGHLELCRKWASAPALAA